MGFELGPPRDPGVPAFVLEGVDEEGTDIGPPLLLLLLLVAGLGEE